jgi:hypothetical protein
MLLINKIVFYALISVLLMSGIHSSDLGVVAIAYHIDLPVTIPVDDTDESNHLGSHVDEFTTGISYVFYRPFYSNHSYSLPVPFSENKNVSGIWQPPKSI